MGGRGTVGGGTGNSWWGDGEQLVGGMVGGGTVGGGTVGGRTVGGGAVGGRTVGGRTIDGNGDMDPYTCTSWPIQVHTN